MRRITTSLVSFAVGAVLCAVFSFPREAQAVTIPIAQGAEWIVKDAAGTAIARAAPRIVAGAVNPMFGAAVATVAILELINASKNPVAQFVTNKDASQGSTSVDPGTKSGVWFAPGTSAANGHAVAPTVMYATGGTCSGPAPYFSSAGAAAAWRTEQEQAAFASGHNGNCDNITTAEHSDGYPYWFFSVRTISQGHDNGLGGMQMQVNCPPGMNRDTDPAHAFFGWCTDGQAEGSPLPPATWPPDGVPTWQWDGTQFQPHPMDPDSAGKPSGVPNTVVEQTPSYAPTTVNIAPNSSGGVTIDQQSSDVRNGETVSTHNGVDLDAHGNVVNQYYYSNTYNNTTSNTTQAPQIQLPTDYARENTQQQIRDVLTPPATDASAGGDIPSQPTGAEDYASHVGDNLVNPDLQSNPLNVPSLPSGGSCVIPSVAMAGWSAGPWDITDTCDKVSVATTWLLWLCLAFGLIHLFHATIQRS